MEKIEKFSKHINSNVGRSINNLKQKFDKNLFTSIKVWKQGIGGIA